MKVHKKIEINKEIMEKAIQHKDLINRAEYWIENYNKNKETSISYTYTGNSSKAIEWGLLQTVDVDWLDEYFVEILGMKGETTRAWDNKTAERIYFFEE